MRLVLDTDVIIAAMRSPSGVSAALLMAIRRGDIRMLANVALALEYEATCRRAEHGIAAGLSSAQVGIFVDAVIALAEPVQTHFLWRPQLRDPGDELVLEAAVNGRANAIVTFNQKDYGEIPMKFSVEVLAPVDALRRIKS
ncbi:MAG: putative toxin-antitoxin system toxin component, PIN family [Pseudomonadota bacterium]|nr:putative toxin-antitoxin system toxin component, PIN family [Pseudomonadota bacterium]